VEARWGESERERLQSIGERAGSREWMLAPRRFAAAGAERRLGAARTAWSPPRAPDATLCFRAFAVTLGDAALRLLQQIDAERMALFYVRRTCRLFFLF